MFTGYFYKPIKYYNCTLYLAKKKKKNQWQTGNLENAPTAVHYAQPTENHQVKVSGKPASFPLTDANLHLEDFCKDLVTAGCFSVDQIFFHKCNQLLKTLLHKHIFPWKLQWLCAMLQELQNRLFYISDLSVFMCCLKVNHKTLQLMQSCNTVPDVNSSGIFKSQMLTFLSFWNPVLSFIF